MKLIKTADEQGVMYSLSGDNLPENYVLSKQNCDEEFAKAMGLVDVEKLAELAFPICDVWSQEESMYRKLSFKRGFNKAMELNKDKVFTLEDVRKAFNKGYLMKFNPSDEYTETLTGLVQSLQQPTEIEVTFNPEEKDSEGCLILKRVA